MELAEPLPSDPSMAATKAAMLLFVDEVMLFRRDTRWKEFNAPNETE